jgi:hypothetical protein
LRVAHRNVKIGAPFPHSLAAFFVLRKLRCAGDITRSLGFRLTKNEPVKIGCAVADFDLQSGDLRAKTLVLDTTDTNVTGEGHVDLGRERLDLKLNDTQNTRVCWRRARC